MVDPQTRQNEQAVDLEAIRARCEAATEGPWSAGDVIDGKFCHQYGDFGWYVSGPDGSPELSDSEQGKADASFIAAARSDVPALVAMVERLQQQLEAVRALVDHGPFRDVGFGHQHEWLHRDDIVAALSPPVSSFLWHPADTERNPE